jgi:hypothetical protein
MNMAKKTAAAKSAPKKEKKEFGWKAKAVREFVASNKSAGAQEIADALTKKHGEEFSYNQVYQLLNKPKGKKKGKPGRKPKTTGGGGIVDNGSPISLAAALLGKTGSVEAAQKALAEVASVAEMLKKNGVPF